MRVTRRKLARQVALGAGAAALGAAPQTSRAQSGGAKPFPKAEGLTRQVAEFIVKTRYADLPPEVLNLGKISILDGIGLGFAGSVAETGEITRTYVKALGLSRADATLIGSNIKAPVRFAAFVNGVGIHADDYDDTQLAVAADRVYGLLTHPTAPALPATLADAEKEGKSGRDLMLAYHVGVEVECKVAEAIAPRHYDEGFHSTGTCGCLGSSAGLSKLRGYDAERTARTLSIAASQAAGLRENFGTMTKPFHAGRASEAGVLAADLAALGWTATDEILEAPRGFFRAAGGGFDPAAIVGKLGQPWTFQMPGISIKPHPSGSLTHPGMTEMLRLIKEHDIKPENVERVDVGTNRNMPNALIHHQPKNSLQAKFSMEFCMAALLLYRKAGLLEFTDEVVNRPAVKSMIARVKFGVHPAAEKAGYNKMTTILDIHLKDGRTISGRTDFAKGSPANPMTFEEVAAKFTDCAAFAKWPAAKAQSIVEMVRKLENVPNVRALTALCGA
jgi:2-methylcitrate dehydratase PrpD